MKINYWEKFEGRCFYHIYNRSNNGENLFLSDENFNFFLRKWRRLISPYLDTYAYCLMPNHFHFLAKVKPLTTDLLDMVKREKTVKSVRLLGEEIGYNEFLEDQFKRLFSSYALAFNKQQSRRGSLFQKRFKRVSVKNEYKLLHLLAYIHHNPIHHKFCDQYDSWLYNSFNAYLSKSSTFISREEALTWFEKTGSQKGKDEFLKYHDEFKENYSSNNDEYE